MSQNLSRDLLASIVIFLVALPLNLGIALASGVSPTVGILSGIVAGIVVGTLAGCPLQVSGPAAGLIAIVWQIVDNYGLATLGPVVLLAGLLQIALGVSKLAPYFRAVAPSVIRGMLAGIGVLIFASQLQVMLDQKPKVSGLDNLMSIPHAIAEVLAGGGGHPSALIGLLTIFSIIAWNKTPKRFQVVPGSLIGVCVAVLAALLIGPDIKYVDFPTDGLPKLEFLNSSQMKGLLSLGVLGSALALALVATAQTLLTATAVDRMHDGPKTDYNREVIAQGFGNAVCGLLNLLPVSGVIVRSATNVEAGASSRLSSVLHGVWVALFLLYFSPALRFVPLPALAAVLVYTGYRLVDLKAVKELRKFGRSEIIIYGITLGCVVSIDLLSGIVLGFAASAAKLIYTLTHCSITVKKQDSSGIILVQLRGSATFFTLPSLADKLAGLPPKHEVHLFLKGLNHIDHACLEQIMRWEESYLLAGGDVYIEWDHLMERFHKPLTAEISRLSEVVEPPSSRAYESYDILASRALVIDTRYASSWDALGQEILKSLPLRLPQQALTALQKELSLQLSHGSFPVVGGVALPHVMVEGLTRHELLVVRMAEPLEAPGEPQTVEATLILLGPKNVTEHLNILARISERAEEQLLRDLRQAEDELSVRETLLRHDRYVTVFLEPGKESETLSGKSLWQLSDLLPKGCLVSYIDREGQSFVPTGSTKLQLGDRLLILGSEQATASLYYRFVKARPDFAFSP